MSDRPATYWVRVEAPHLVAALKVSDGRCVEAAPILRWALGMSADELRDYFRRKGWHATVSRVQVRT